MLRTFAVLLLAVLPACGSSVQQHETAAQSRDLNAIDDAMPDGHWHADRHPIDPAVAPEIGRQIRAQAVRPPPLVPKGTPPPKG